MLVRDNRGGETLAPVAAGVTCGACHQSVAPGRFCAACGAEMKPEPAAEGNVAAAFCAGCGSALGPDSKFCGQCGKAR
jgi:predicted nucleic acid-binding Zn ribbon protein